LDISKTSIGSETISHLCQNPKELNYLDVSETKVVDQDVRNILKSDLGQKMLKTLHANKCGLTHNICHNVETYYTKLHEKKIPGIETLGLSEHNFTDEDITPLNKKFNELFKTGNDNNNDRIKHLKIQFFYCKIKNLHGWHPAIDCSSLTYR